MRKETRRLNRILSDFLIFARPREPKRLVGDIQEIIDHVAALIREGPDRAHDVELSVRVEPAVPSFPFDADQITQVVWNIALNGVEAMDGCGQLSIAVSLGDAQVAIAISDTGRGIPAEERRRVFEPFYSESPLVPASASPSRGVSWRRTAGESRSSRRPGAVPASPFSSRSADRTTMATILVVDDESSARTTLGLLLRKRSHRVTEVEGVAAAVKALTDVVFDVIVTDLRMPDGDGLDVLRAARAHCPGADVILLTAYAGWESAKEAIQLGACDYFEKGHKPDELLHSIDKAIAEKELRRGQPPRAGARSLRAARISDGSARMAGARSPYGAWRPRTRRCSFTASRDRAREVAKAIHHASQRARGSFVAINCAALPETRLESGSRPRQGPHGAATNKKGLREAWRTLYSTRSARCRRACRPGLPRSRAARSGPSARRTPSPSTPVSSPPRTAISRR
jgi:CheY-like chemotaxis protein